MEVQDQNPRSAVAKLGDSIIEYGTKAFHPNSASSPTELQAARERFTQLINK
jgi:hypothetical protein